MRFADIRTRCAWVESITNVINHEVKLKELNSKSKETSRVTLVLNYINMHFNRLSSNNAGSWLSSREVVLDDETTDNSEN